MPFAPPPIVIPAPIIVPAQIQCIVVEGKKYCEDTSLTSKEFGILAFLFVGSLVWLCFWAWLSVERENPLILIGGGFVLPALVIGLIAYFS